MAKPRPIVALGLLGPNLDAGRDQKRWNRWRPTVGLHMQDDLQISRFEMLHQRRFDSLAEGIAADIRQVSPTTVVRSRHIEFGDAWDFEEVYGALWGFAAGYAWKPDEEDYLSTSPPASSRRSPVPAHRVAPPAGAHRPDHPGDAR
jgi:transcriptional regulatory protein RtcR